MKEKQRGASPLFIKSKLMNPDYIIAKEFLSRLPDQVKVKLCKTTLAGVEEKKLSKKQKVRRNLDYFKTK